MAHEISQFTRPVAPHSGFPYGDIANDPSGTLVNRLFLTDIIQFFQRIAANAGISLNGNDDSSVNGYQFVQALNTLINQEGGGMATAFGGGGLTPVIMSGCVFAMGGSTYTLTAGWFFYNGQYVYCVGTPLGPRPNPTGGQVVLLTIALVDGLPVATISNASTVTDATHFPQSIMVGWSAAVGIDALNSEIALGAWTNITLGTGYSNNSGTTAQVRKDGQGRVFIKGYLLGSGSSGIVTVATIPGGYRPVQAMVRPCSCANGGVEFTKGMSVDPSTGIITFFDPTVTPATNWTVVLDGLGSWLTT